MAGAWIAMRCDLPTDPSVMRIAAALNIPNQHVVGALHAVWSWFDAHTTRGKALVRPALIDELSGVQGFAEAMEDAGWLRVTSNAVTIPRFNRFMSQSAKKRALTAQRVARHRKRKRNAVETSVTLPEDRTAESEKREEKKTENSAAALASGAVRGVGGNGRGNNPPAVDFEIKRLMADRGCDESLRGVVAKGGDVQIVRQLATEYDRGKDHIQNAGGWWRDRLRRAGMKDV